MDEHDRKGLLVGLYEEASAPARIMAGVVDILDGDADARRRVVRRHGRRPLTGADNAVVVRGHAVALLAVMVVAVGCTQESQPPPSLVSPAPESALRECIKFPVRAPLVDPATIRKVLDDHLPTILPAGFGLVGPWGSGGTGPGAPAGSAIWVDSVCRSVAITTWRFADARIMGPQVGSFTLVSRVPPTCVRPGPKPCLAYRAALPPGLVEVDVVGIGRHDADAIVRSIP